MVEFSLAAVSSWLVSFFAEEPTRVPQGGRCRSPRSSRRKQFGSFGIDRLQGAVQAVLFGSRQGTSASSCNSLPHG